MAPIRSSGTPVTISARWLGGGAVALVHLAFLLALLLTDKLTLHKPGDGKPMVVYRIPEEQTAPAAVRLPTPKSAAPPIVTLTPPQFRVAPPSSAITIMPAEKAAPAPAPQAGRPNYNDLFPADKKQQLKQFFTDQAAEDRRENAKPDHHKSPCDLFKKPDDLGEVGPRSNTGIPQNFKPGMVMSFGASDPSVQACN